MYLKHYYHAHSAAGTNPNLPSRTDPLICYQYQSQETDTNPPTFTNPIRGLILTHKMGSVPKILGLGPILLQIIAFDPDPFALRIE